MQTLELPLPLWFPVVLFPFINQGYHYLDDLHSACGRFWDLVLDVQKLAADKIHIRHMNDIYRWNNNEFKANYILRPNANIHYENNLP